MTLRRDVAEWLTEWCQSTTGRQILSELPTGRAAQAGVIRLRKLGLSLEQASAVVELVELRERAAGKFEHAHELFFTRRAYEQASGQATARWKVALLKKRWPNQPLVVLDLCCGMGGDLLEVSRHFPTIGLDRDEALVSLTQENLRRLQRRSERLPSIVASADVNSILPPEPYELPTEGVNVERPEGHFPGRLLGDWIRNLPPSVGEWALKHRLLKHGVVWHLDPDRRSAQGRHTCLSDMSPNEDFLSALVNWSPQGMVKLAPATELDMHWSSVGHWQWLGADRECKQLLGCFGFEPFLEPGRSSVAVAQRDGSEWDWWRPSPGVGNTVSRIRQPLTYLYEPHAAVFAARLNHQFAAERSWQQLAGGDYYSGNELTEPIGELFASFRVLEVLPFRIERIRDWLKQHGRPLAEIKSRTVPEKDWRSLSGLLGNSLGLERTDGLSGLIFQQSKPEGLALRVALCERLVCERLVKKTPLGPK